MSDTTVVSSSESFWLAGAAVTPAIALAAAQSLMLLHGIVENAPGQAMLALLEELAAPQPVVDRVLAAYARTYRALAAVADDEPIAGLVDAWVAYLTARLVDGGHPWSDQAQRGGSIAVAPGLRAQAERDLQAVQVLLALEAHTVLREVRSIAAIQRPNRALSWTAWRDLAAPVMRGDASETTRAALRRRLATARALHTLADELEMYWARQGTGLVARYRAVRWDRSVGALRGISDPDAIRLEDLVGYEREQALLTANIERFLAGFPAHDALLYGAPGTGKSSTVKALCNAYAAQGLRLLELGRNDLADLPAVADAVRPLAPRFVLFIDDLSFEEHETDYKVLKATLEGTAARRPANLLIHATTNRFNLIRENFADRGQPGDDVHSRDTLQEKISLAARFGLRVTFGAPDQERYLAIVTALATQRGLNLPPDELRRRALLWERQHPGRSGRTARRVIDDLDAERQR